MPGRTPFSPGGGRLDHPGAPGTEAPLCGGVRDPPWALTTTFPPFVMVWALRPPRNLPFPYLWLPWQPPPAFPSVWGPIPPTSQPLGGFLR